VSLRAETHGGCEPGPAGQTATVSSKADEPAGPHGQCYVQQLISVATRPPQLS